MITTHAISRRSLLANAAALGLTVNFLGNVAFGAADSALARRKLIVIVCRGAMDGLSVFPPVGDPNYTALRGTLAVPGFGAIDGALKVDSYFGLHPALTTVHKLAMARQARIAPAVATPDRSRSHFEAQDVLESGVGTSMPQSGWLNRALQSVSASRKVSGLSIGAEMPLILQGKIEVATWSPGALGAEKERLTQVLSDLYANDALLGPALASGLEAGAIAEEAGVLDVEPPMRGRPPRSGGAGVPQAQLARQKDIARKLAKAMAALMAAEHGPSIAAISVTGFDTHQRQKERLAYRLAYLDGVIDGLATGLGAKWKDTVIVAITEFGRVARANGSSGTDHGTASSALLLGGTIKAGGIIGDWPTLQTSKLFQNRDLAPSLDMRSLLKAVLAEHLAVDTAHLDTIVFPNSAQAPALKSLIV